MKTQIKFVNASLVSVVNGSIVVKSAAGIEHTCTNASVVSVNNGTIIIESEWEPKKGELIKVIGSGIDCYVIFNSKTGCILNTFGNKKISGNWYYLESHIWVCNNYVKFYPVTPEEQKEFDDFCKSQGKIWNKETLQWEKCRWKPKDSEGYFTLTMLIGNIEIINYIWTNDFLDTNLYKIGNCFKTRKEAEAKLKQIKKLLLEV